MAIGVENFERFFNSYQFERLIVNTLTLGLYLLVVGFPIPISPEKIQIVPVQQVMEQ